jgi:hypothetical protein
MSLGLALLLVVLLVIFFPLGVGVLKTAVLIAAILVFVALLLNVLNHPRL